MSYKKYLNSDRPTFDSYKENIHPNIIQQTTHQDDLNYFPKISSFQIQQDSKSHKKLLIKKNTHNNDRDWRKTILQPSQRQKILDRKLKRMLHGTLYINSMQVSPQKINKQKLATQAQSNSQNQTNTLGNTLLRYLYEKSIQNVSFSEKNTQQIVDDLVKVVEDLCQTNIKKDYPTIDETLMHIIESLKQYKTKKQTHNLRA